MDGWRYHDQGKVSIEHLAHSCAKPTRGHGYKDPKEVRPAFKHAKREGTAALWKQALKLRKEARKTWEFGRLHRAGQGEWHFFKSLAQRAGLGRGFCKGEILTRRCMTNFPRAAMVGSQMWWLTPGGGSSGLRCRGAEGRSTTTEIEKRAKRLPPLNFCLALWRSSEGKGIFLNGIIGYLRRAHSAGIGYATQDSRPSQSASSSSHNYGFVKLLIVHCREYALRPVLSARDQVVKSLTSCTRSYACLSSHGSGETHLQCSN